MLAGELWSHNALRQCTLQMTYRLSPLRSGGLSPVISPCWAYTCWPATREIPSTEPSPTPPTPPLVPPPTATPSPLLASDLWPPACPFRLTFGTAPLALTLSSSASALAGSCGTSSSSTSPSSSSSSSSSMMEPLAPLAPLLGRPKLQGKESVAPSESSARLLPSSDESSTVTSEGLTPAGHTWTSDISISVSSSVVAMGAHSRLETSCQYGSTPNGEGKLYCMEAGDTSSSCTSP